MGDAPDIAREEVFRAHLKDRYGVCVEHMERLDRGVVSVQLRDGRRWIARFFPKDRSLAQVESDAAVLQFLEQQDIPAERCTAFQS